MTRDIKAEQSGPIDLAARAEAAISARPSRVQSFEMAGKRYWVKRAERLTLRMRLQKGNPRRAFVTERTALHELRARGAAVPPILAEGPDFFVLPDCGPTLTHLLRTNTDLGERLRAFDAAARTLAAFHAKALSHGRPSIKDICWNGETVTFLDVERYAARRNNTPGHVQDLLIMVFSAFAETGGPSPETDRLIAAYRETDPGGIWAGAQALCRKLRWIGPLTWPVRRLRNAPEFHAIPPTLAAFGSA